MHEQEVVASGRLPGGFSAVIIALTDDEGNVIGRAEYDVYGAPLTGATITETPYRFTGESWDDPTGLLYLRARFYDPSVGRFLTKDPFRGSMQSSLSQQPYSYVQGCPTSRLDPSGLWTCGIGASATGGAVAGGSYSGMLVVDGEGNVGIAHGPVGGSYIGMGGSGGLAVQCTTAATIYDLEGVTLEIAGSVGEGLSVGGAYVSGGKYHGGELDVGFGGGLFPIEQHTMAGKTWLTVIGWNWLDWYNRQKAKLRELLLPTPGEIMRKRSEQQHQCGY